MSPKAQVMEFKTTVRYSLSPLEQLLKKRQNVINAVENVEQKETLSTADEKVN